MRAMLSNPGSGVTGLRSDLYQADERWLTLTAVEEAQRILAVADPAVKQDYTPYRPLWTARGTVSGINGTLVGAALAEALRAFVA